MNEFAAPEAKPQFDISRVFNLTFGAIRRNFISFTIASFIVVGIPQILFGLAPLLMGVFDTASEDMLGAMAPIIVLGLLSSLVIILLQFILQGAIIHASMQDFNDETAPFRDSVRVARKYIWPLIGFAILATLGILAGMIMFIIPGVILMLMWMVGIPALIIEETGVSGAFTRSADLTSGYKWWIFLLIIIFAIIGSIISAAGAVIAAPLGGSLQEVLMSGGSLTAPYLIMSALINAVVQTFSTLVSAAGTAAIYYELRRIKEGVGPKSIGAIFD